MSLALSSSDKKILSALQRDASLNSRDLAEKLSMSQSTLWRRVNELEKSGLIKKRVALLDPDKLGVTICVFVNISLKNHTTQDREEFQNFVLTIPEIVECFSVTGTHDYTLIVKTHSMTRFETLLMHSILTHTSVASASSQVALRQHKYSTELPL